MADMKITVLPAKRRTTNTNAPADVKKTRVAAYCRVSTDNEEQETSYDVQVQHFTEYIGSRSDWELAGIYADDGISGTNTKKREEFNRMIDDAMAGEIDLIITKSISRFARNTVDCLNTIRELKEKNVPVIFEKENINSMDASGELLLTIMSSIAQQESDSLSKNVKIGLQYRFQQGKMMVNYNRFLGYTRDEEGNLVVVPEEAKTVKRIYREYLEGKSTAGIARGLEKDGILNGAKNKKWWDTNIEQILQNEKYIGDAILQKTYTVDFLQKKRAVNDGIVPQYYVENSHEAIIPDQIFMEVQAEIARRAAMRKASGGRTVYCSKYALSGTLVCGECGSPYGRTHWNPHGKKVYVWKCRKRSKEGPTGCDGRNLHEEDVHAAVVQAIRQTICNPDVEYRKISKEILGETGGDCQGQIEAIDQKLTDLQAQVVEKVKDNDQYNSLVDKIQALREKKAKLTEEQALYTRNEERIATLRKELEASGDETLTYDDKLVRDFIEKIEVFPEMMRFTMKAGMVTEVKR